MHSVSILNMYCQKLKIKFPVYETINKLGEDHNPIYEVKCVFKSISEVGKGSSIKLAKEDAARKIIKVFDIENEILKLDNVTYIESYNTPLSDIWDNKIQEYVLTLNKKNKDENEIKKFKVKILHIIEN